MLPFAFRFKNSWITNKQKKTSWIFKLKFFSCNFFFWVPSRYFSVLSFPVIIMERPVQYRWKSFDSLGQWKLVFTLTKIRCNLQTELYWNIEVEKLKFIVEYLKLGEVTVSCAVQKLFSLLLYHLSIFAFVICAFAVISKKSLTRPTSRSFSSMFYYDSFIVSGLMFEFFNSSWF